MFTSAPDITNDATIGQIIVPPTATPTASPTVVPTATPTPTATSTSTTESTTTTTTSSTTTAATTAPTRTPEPIYTFPTLQPERRFRSSSLTIYGYGPINSKVTLRGFGISEKTMSDSTGLFKFSDIYSLSYSYPELCIQAEDENKRVTQPTCIPGLPNNSLIPLEIGPILLSPTLSLSSNRIILGSMSYLSGKTTPNTKVNIYLARNRGYTLPTVSATSDEKGEFDINMPTSDIADYKVFASTDFSNHLSPKSNTLQFAVISSSKSFFQSLLDFFLQNKIMALVVAEVLVFIMLFISALKSIKKGHKRHTEKDYLESVKRTK